MTGLSNYYLVKCFSKDEYRKSFNAGTDIHIKSTGYFWKLENTFQQDLEGLIFRQSGEGYLIRTNSEFENVVRASSSLDDIKSKIPQYGEILTETENFFTRIDGYICCFYLLPKSSVEFDNGEIRFLNSSEEKDLLYFLDRYYEESKALFASIYDAIPFRKIFCDGMLERGYEIITGGVKYEDLTVEDRIQRFQQKDYQSLVFTKPVDYSYQKEFRIFLTNKEEQCDFISENGIEIYKNHVYSFDDSLLVKYKDY